MKRNRTQALGFVLDHRKKIVKGLSALLQVLEKFPDGVSVTELLAAGKAAAKKPGSKASRPAAMGESKKTKSRPVAKPRVLAEPKSEELAPAAVAQPESDPALMQSSGA